MNCFFCNKNLEHEPHIHLKGPQGQDIVSCETHHGVLEEKQEQEQ